MSKKTKPEVKLIVKDLNHKQRLMFIGYGLVALGLAYLVGSRAIDTASWWEYGFTFILIGIGVHRIYCAARGRVKRYE